MARLVNYIITLISLQVKGAVAVTAVDVKVAILRFRDEGGERG